MFMKRIKKACLYLLLLIVCCSVCTFGVVKVGFESQSVEAGKYIAGEYVRDEDEEKDYQGLKEKYLFDSIGAIGEEVEKLGGDAEEIKELCKDIEKNEKSIKAKLGTLGANQLTIDKLDKYLKDQKEKQNKGKTIEKCLSQAEDAAKIAVSVINLCQQDDKDWGTFAFDTAQLATKIGLSFVPVPGLDKVASGIFTIIDACLKGSSPLSETQKLTNTMKEEFSKVSSQLGDIQNDIASLSNEVSTESNRVINQLTTQMRALDAGQYVRTFTISGEGNFSYNQLYNYLYGTTDPTNIYYTQSYYNALLEAIVNDESEDIIKTRYDDLYNSLMSIATDGQSNYIKYIEYLTGDKSISQYYYDYLSANRQLLDGSESAEEKAIDYAKEKYTTALFAGSLIQMCNSYQLSMMKNEYGDRLNNNSRYYYNNITGEYVTYGEILANVEYVNNVKEVLLKNLMKDIAYISNMGDSYTVEESDGLVYIVSDSSNDSFGNVVLGQKVYLNQMYSELFDEIIDFNPDDFIYYRNGAKGEAELLIDEASINMAVYYKDVELFTINFHTVTNQFNGGNGSKRNPYNISNVNQLMLISDDLEGNYRLIKNIDCEFKTINTIGDQKNHFSGVFDGNGYSINNLNVVGSTPEDTTKPLYAGLFSYIEDGKVLDLTVNKLYVKSDYEKDKAQAYVTESKYYCGIIAGYNEGTISNCTIISSELFVNRYNKVLDRNINVYAGGIVGSNFGLVSGCSVEEVSIEANSYHSYQAQKDSDNKNNVYVGGIAGQSYGYIRDSRVNDRTRLSGFAESYCSTKKSTQYPYINVYVGGVCATGTAERIERVFSEAQVVKCDYKRKNTGAGGSFTDNCKTKQSAYMPGASIVGLSSYDGVNITPKHRPVTEISCVGEVENGSTSLSKDNLNVVIDGKRINNYTILGFYGFNSKNPNAYDSCENNVNVIISYYEDDKQNIVSNNVTLVIARDSVKEVEIKSISTDYHNGDTLSSIYPALFVLKYASGNSEEISASEYTIEFVNEQEAFKYGDNAVRITYKGHSVEHNINVECLHDYKYESIEATCGHDGYEYKTCIHCGDQVVISHTEKETHHTLITIEEATPSTCTLEGHTGRVYCEECGHVLVESSIIPKKNHSFTYLDETEHVCSECGLREAHQYMVSESLNEDGHIVYTYTCVGCKYTYSEVDENTITDTINSLPRLAVSDGYALNGGDLVTVFVQLLNNPGITGANFGIRYDDRLTLVGWSEGTILPKMVDENHEVNCGWNFLWGSADATYESGNVLVLTFRVPYDAKITDKYNIYTVYGLVNSSDGGFSLNANDKVQKFSTRAGTISMVDHLPGDVNNDGVVDLMDSVYTARYLVNKIENIENKYADVNLDGKVNLNDVVDSLRSLIGGYGVNFLNQEFEVVLDTNGASVDYDNLVVSIYSGNNTYELPTPSREGYKFIGWNTRIYGNDGRFVNDGDVVIYDNKQLTQTLYARWEPNGVVFDMNGATSEQASSVFYSTSNQTVVLPLPEKQYAIELYHGTEFLTTKTFSFEFKHWLNEQTGEVYAAGTTYSLKNSSEGITTLKAIWKIEPNYDQLSCNKEGYEFGGYYYEKPQVTMIINSDEIIDEQEAIALNNWIERNGEGDRKLFAFFTQIKRTISLNANGGISTINEMSVTYDSTYNKFLTPTRTGYRFVGWFINDVQITDSDGSIIDNTVFFRDNKSKITNNVMAKAIWEAKTVTVSFDKNTIDPIGGDLSSIQVKYDGKYSVNPQDGGVQSLPELVRIGYSFEGWYTASSGGVKITDESSVNNGENHVLYAHWSPMTYVVTFDASTNGGACEDTSKNVSYETKYGELPVATKVGSTFVGWFTTSSGGTEITEDTIVKITKDQTLYARFSTNAFEVVFDANGGTCNTSTKQVEYEKAYGKLPVPTKVGYKFVGWYTEENGGNLITEDSINAVEGSQTLYAHWEIANSIVTLDFNSIYNGSIIDAVVCEKDSFVINYGEAYSSLPTTATRTGYNFLGWYTLANGGIKVELTDVHTSENDITLYAHWESKEYRITFYPQNGVGEARSINVRYRGYLEIPQYIRDGYDFAGWYTSSEGGTCAVDRNGIKSNTYFKESVWSYDGDLNLYAHWIKQTYRVTGTVLHGSVYWALDGIPKSSTNAYVDAELGQTVYYKIVADEGYNAPLGATGSYEVGDLPIDKIKLTATIDFEACTPKTPNVTFDANTGTCATNSRVVTFDSEYGELPNASKTGYSFTGWFTQISGGTKVEGNSLVNNGNDHTLYAHWEAITYTVTGLTTNGTVYWATNPISTSGGSTSISAKYDSTLYYRVEANEGYQLSVATYGEIVLDNTNFILSGSNAERVISATIINRVYNVTFDKNNSVLPISVGLTRSTGSITYLSKAITGIAREDNKYFDIEGWYINGKKVADGEGILEKGTSYTNSNGEWTYPYDVTLYANWKKSIDKTYIAKVAKTGYSITLSQIDSTGSYLLIENIDFGGSNWTPIASFSGTLDGDSHTISNLVIQKGTSDSNPSTENSAIYFGLFGNIENGGKVLNLNVSNFNIAVWKYRDDQAGNYAGVIAGYIYNGDVINCRVNNCSVFLRNVRHVGSGNEFWVYAGGIVGRIDGGKIDNCIVANSSVQGQAYKPKGNSGSVYSYVGGIAGYANGKYGVTQISYCTSNNNFLRVSCSNEESGGGATAAGGICGVLYAEKLSATVSNCSVTVADKTRHSSANLDPGIYIYKTNDSNLKIYAGKIVGRKRSGTISSCSSNLDYYYRSYSGVTDKQVSLSDYSS